MFMVGGEERFEEEWVESWLPIFWKNLNFWVVGNGRESWGRKSAIRGWFVIMSFLGELYLVVLCLFYPESGRRTCRKAC